MCLLQINLPFSPLEYFCETLGFYSNHASTRSIRIFYLSIIINIIWSPKYVQIKICPTWNLHKILKSTFQYKRFSKFQNQNSEFKASFWFSYKRFHISAKIHFKIKCTHVPKYKTYKSNFLNLMCISNLFKKVFIQPHEKTTYHGHIHTLSKHIMPCLH